MALVHAWGYQKSSAYHFKDVAATFPSAVRSKELQFTDFSEAQRAMAKLRKEKLLLDSYRLRLTDEVPKLVAAMETAKGQSKKYKTTFGREAIRTVVAENCAYAAQIEKQSWR